MYNVLYSIHYVPRKMYNILWNSGIADPRKLLASRVLTIRRNALMDLLQRDHHIAISKRFTLYHIYIYITYGYTILYILYV